MTEESLKTIKEPLAVVLDFVERWNKQDQEPEAAQAAAFLETLLTQGESKSE
jgi:hypothetical protein